MPYTIKKNANGSYSVHSPTSTLAKHTSKVKAEAQVRIFHTQTNEESRLNDMSLIEKIIKVRKRY